MFLIIYLFYVQTFYNLCIVLLFLLQLLDYYFLYYSMFSPFLIVYLFFNSFNIIYLILIISMQHRLHYNKEHNKFKYI